MSIIIPGQQSAGQIQLPGQPFLKGRDQEVIKERHDVDATHEAIQQMLAGGTPNWVKWPHEYKAYARECFQAEKEVSNKMASGYKWDDQDDLTNEGARKINKTTTRDFLKKLNDNGIKTAIFDNGWIGPGGIPTIALFCVPPSNTKKLRPVCYLDVPTMWEWSILLLDSHGIPNGEKSRGWRTVAIQLVEKEIITETQCHKIFGVPSPNAVSARYFRSLWEKRNGRRFVDLEDQEALGQSA